MRTSLLLALLFIGCHSKPTPTVTAVATAEAIAPSASASVTTTRPHPAPLTPTQVVERWNKAHIDHDLATLRALYGSKVQFYGQSYSNKECVAAKKAAFAKAPDYTQTVRDVVVHEEQVSFTKTSTIKGKSTDYPGILIVVGGVIVGETDKVTEANLAARAAKDASWCVDENEPVIPRAGAINDKVIPPFKISAAAANQIILASSHNEDLLTKVGETPIPGDVACPTRCDRTRPTACSYAFTLVTFPKYDEEMPMWHIVDWVYVDAIDGTLRWEDYDVDGGSVWRSEHVSK